MNAQPLATVPCERCGGSGQLPDDKALGEQMREARSRVGVSQRAVARRMKVSAAYVNDLEFGRRHWRAALLGRYRQALEEGVSP